VGMIEQGGSSMQIRTGPYNSVCLNNYGTNSGRKYLAEHLNLNRELRVDDFNYNTVKEVFFGGAGLTGISKSVQAHHDPFKTVGGLANGWKDVEAIMPKEPMNFRLVSAFEHRAKDYALKTSEIPNGKNYFSGITEQVGEGWKNLKQNEKNPMVVQKFHTLFHSALYETLGEWINDEGTYPADANFVAGYAKMLSADENNNGVLEPEEFAKLFKTTRSQFCNAVLFSPLDFEKVEESYLHLTGHAPKGFKRPVERNANPVGWQGSPPEFPSCALDKNSPKWIPDKDKNGNNQNCCVCDGPTSWGYRHHCRCCGALTCNSGKCFKKEYMKIWEKRQWDKAKTSDGRPFFYLLQKWIEDPDLTKNPQNDSIDAETLKLAITKNVASLKTDSKRQIFCKPCQKKFPRCVKCEGKGLNRKLGSCQFCLGSGKDTVIWAGY